MEVIYHNANVLGRYTLDAFVVMSNHVHMLVSPNIPLPRLAKALKGFTAKRANQMLARTGSPFWQEERYDRLVRDRAEWERIKVYIEENPVRAGLVKQARQVPVVECGLGDREVACGPGGLPYREGVDLL